MEQSFLYKGKVYHQGNLENFASLPEVQDGIMRDLYQFLLEWFDTSFHLQVFTSGSTGAPKPMLVEKAKMMNSARLTCETLGLQAGDKALLCMPLRYIAGKMVVVRALVAGLELVVREPSGHPLADVEDSLQFAAMIPLQVYNSLQCEEERCRLQKIERLIIGGGAIDSAIEEELRSFPNAIYSTYGMTETLSHIALRRLNGKEASICYKPFPTVSVSLSNEQTLVIKAPLVCDEELRTNDVAELNPDGSFRILGRKDNIINTGGVKVQIEEVEAILKPYLSCPFAVTSLPDAKFGEIIVLLVETTAAHYALPEIAESILPKYKRPKHVKVVSALPLTETGKISRAACRQLAKG